MAQAISPSRKRRVRRPRKTGPKAPVLKTTSYDVAWSFMIALLIGGILVTAWIAALWLANRRIKTENTTQIEMLTLGGYEDGAPNETLKVESPEDPTDDPSVEEVQDENQTSEIVENIIQNSNRTAQQVPAQTELASENTGKIGSKDGTGRRPLGSGGGEGNTGLRWFIRLGERVTIDEYAKQLDYFGIELGLLQPGFKTVRIMSNISKSPTFRTATGKDIKATQWVFTWVGGGRKKADIQLLEKKGRMTVGNGLILHFYPQSTIQLIGQLEADTAKADGKKVSQIVRSYFGVRPDGGGYKFVITKIVYE